MAITILHNTIVASKISLVITVQPFALLIKLPATAISIVETLETAKELKKFAFPCLNLSAKYKLKPITDHIANKIQA